MVKVGIIGAGRIGRVHITSITTRVPNAKIKTVADPFLSEETADWAKSMGVEKTTKDYKEIIEDPEIDAVLICSSTDTHSPISVEAIKAGKHVFCEKPIDHDVEKIMEVIKALEGTNLKYQVGFNRRFDHNFQSLQEAVAQGKVGTPQIIKITSRDPEPPSIDYVKVSGGMFLDMTIHDFDMVRFLAGCDAEEVYVQSANLVDPAIGEAGDVDTAVITLKMENGAIAVIDNCRKAVYGYAYTVIYGFLLYNYLNTILLSVLLFAVLKKQYNNKILNIISLLPALYSLMYYIGINNKWIYSHLLYNADAFSKSIILNNYSEPFISLITGTLIIVIIIYCIFKIKWQNTELKYLTFLFFAAGLMSAFILSFSPTIYASKDRIWFIPFSMYVLSTGMVFMESLKNIDIYSKKYVIIYLLLCICCILSIFFKVYR